MCVLYRYFNMQKKSRGIMYEKSNNNYFVTCVKPTFVSELGVIQNQFLKLYLSKVLAIHYTCMWMIMFSQIVHVRIVRKHISQACYFANCHLNCITNICTVIIIIITCWNLMQPIIQIIVYVLNLCKTNMQKCISV